MNDRQQLPPLISTAILAGGASTRMGQNKALFRPVPGGSSLIEMVIARLAEAELPPPVIITNSPTEYRFLGLETAPDEIAGIGPIGGILTALRHSSYSRVLVVGCDMPFLNPSLLRYMASIHGDYDLIIPTWINSSGARMVEPLHAIYSKHAIPVIEQRAEAGKLKLSDLPGSLNSTYIEEDTIRKHDPGLLSFRNINTPGEWERLLI